MKEEPAKKTPRFKLTLPMIRTAFLVIAICLIAYGVGFWVGQRDVRVSMGEGGPDVTVVNKSVPGDKDVDFGLFWQVWKLLEENYIDEEKLVKEEMVWGAIKGMTASIGDPYTVFLPPVQNEETRQELAGSFEGIGAQLGMKEERIVVVAPLKGMPAEKAGMLAGDIIVEVDGEETYGWTVPEAVENIRGEGGTDVVITVLHEGADELDELTITRGKIEVPTVETEFRDNVAIIRLFQFNETATNQWVKAVDEIVETCYSNGKECDGIVLDLRNNPGGFMDGAVFVASEFLKDGIVVKQEYANGRQDRFPVNRPGKLYDPALVVLVNKGSASASEIVAGALKVRDRATIVGETSFGKGSIQERQELDQNAGLHITVAKWILPDDSWINEVGVSPDVEVEYDPETEEDDQLEAAIRVLTGQEPIVSEESEDTEE